MPRRQSCFPSGPGTFSFFAQGIDILLWCNQKGIPAIRGYAPYIADSSWGGQRQQPLDVGPIPHVLPG